MMITTSDTNDYDKTSTDIMRKYIINIYIIYNIIYIYIFEIRITGRTYFSGLN